VVSAAERSKVLDVEWAITSFDPWHPGLNHGNIWRLYGAMRQHAPTFRSDAHENLWIIPRYIDIKRASADYKTFSSRYGVRIGRMAPAIQSEGARGTPIAWDPPEHTKFRAAMISPFRARHITQFQHIVAAHVSQVLDRAFAKHNFDIVTDIAEPVSVSVISDIIGFDEEARNRNRELSLTLIRADYHQSLHAKAEHDKFLEIEVEKALERPAVGALGDLARQTGDGKPFTRADLIAMLHGLALAGHHTTVNAISSMLLHAADNKIRETWLGPPSDEARISAFIEETLRVDPPIHLEGRWTTKEVSIGDTTIPAGSQVALLYASGNHDEAEFGNPEKFDASRVSGHLSFGHGVHTCLGMALSRMEMASVLKEVLERFPSYSLVEPPHDSGMVYGHHMGWDSIPASIIR
jgi:cytochrome P450